jgi:hypothetical protein
LRNSIIKSRKERDSVFRLVNAISLRISEEGETRKAHLKVGAN